MDSSFDEDVTPKRVPKKRAPAKRVSAADKVTVRAPRKTIATTASVPRKRAPRKTVASVADTVVAKAVSEQVDDDATRKAPTSFGAEQQATKIRRRQLMVVAVVLLTGIGASAAVGFSDKGLIDVQKTIESRNERIRTNTATALDTIVSSVEVPVQDTSADSKDKKIDGGLHGRGTGGSVPNTKAESAITASTTEVSASSTEAVTDNADGSADEVSDTDTQSSDVPAETARPEDAPPTEDSTPEPTI
ncbi:MAG: hypothetical protein RLZZ230_642 [Candidatus Parcubacteria bacterium]|jgi:hypothetical protein